MYTPFAYPMVPHVRRHGPQGYTDYASYKPWLRDEFEFRCVYCLFRERWFPDGHESFSVDHLIPQILSPERVSDYTNLAYTCHRCNSAKGFSQVMDPCQMAYGEHLYVRENGEVEAFSQEGADTLRNLKLNAPYRQYILALVRAFRTSNDLQLLTLYSSTMRYPTDLPDLSVLRPPGGNTQPEGLLTSYHRRAASGDLPALY